jgi:cob(I)alamin adenosyltransferase
MSPTLYTGKGDGGTTKFFGCDQKRVSKSSSVAEALGNLDEVNSFLGLVKVEAEKSDYKILDKSFNGIVLDIQQNIFIISSNIAGADKNLSIEKVTEVEAIIAECEKELPLIDKFTIAGGTELASRFDFARTLARRAERRVVAVNDELGTISPEILKYLNRLSSILFALARLTNLRAGMKESNPTYE